MLSWNTNWCVHLIALKIFLQVWFDLVRVPSLLPKVRRGTSLDLIIIQWNISSLLSEHLASFLQCSFSICRSFCHARKPSSLIKKFSCSNGISFLQKMCILRSFIRREIHDSYFAYSLEKNPHFYADYIIWVCFQSSRLCQSATMEKEFQWLIRNICPASILQGCNLIKS